MSGTAMSQPKRIFHAEPAVRKQVPLLIGIMSPSGGGKTFSALRLATGMQRVMGGEIYGIDTENSRMLHYADRFKFQHVPFSMPFGSLDYLDAVSWASSQGARIIIVDSMTHEHIGAGGYLETAESTVTRIAGPNAGYREREKVQMLGWATAGPLRQKMIEGLKQLNGAFIFCFRAKEKTKPVRAADGKTSIIDMGLMPIAGEEWIYEMTMNCMLHPRSDGVPTWRSDQVGERMMMKLPIQFKEIFADQAPLSEDIGEKLAAWATGSTLPSLQEPAGVGATPSPAAPVPIDDPPAEQETDRLTALDRELSAEAEKGYSSLAKRWNQLTPADQATLKAARDRRWIARAREVDAAANSTSSLL